MAVDVSRCPKSFVETLGLEAISGNVVVKHSFISLFLSVLKAKLDRRNCFYFLNPGGLGATRTNRQRVSATVYNMILFIFRMVGVNVCQVGVSYDRLNKFDIKVARFRSKIMSFLFVRDHGSYSYLKDNDFNVSGVYPDLAFFLDSYSAEGESTRQKVGFSYRVDGRSGATLDSLKALVKESVNLHGASAEYGFISQVDTDDDGMKELKAWFDSNYDLKSDLLCCSTDIEKLRAYYCQCKIIYSNRLHVLLMSGFSGVLPVPVIDPSRNIKIVNLYKSINLESLVVDINSLDLIGKVPEVNVESVFHQQRLTLKTMIKKIIIK